MHPALSGKFGDLCYFFFWMITVAMMAATEKGVYPSWTSYVDTTGFAFMLHQVKSATQSDSLTIGSSKYDMTQAPFVFEGIHLSEAEILPRLVSFLYPLVYLFPALLFFHRFNPDRLKASAQKAHHGWIERINALCKPLTRRILFPFLNGSSSSTSFTRSVFSDALLTFQLNPVAVVMALFSAILAILKPVTTVLPMVFAILSVVLSDIATRENTCGTAGIVYGSPFLKKRFVIWKWASSSMTALVFVAVPLIKMLSSHPWTALSLVIGIALIAAAATALGSMSSNPKTFIVVALLYLYLVVHDGGKTASFDIGGWYNTATAEVKLGYALTAVFLIAAAELQHRWKLQRV